jgi:capsular polysaccharide transport system permease protein
MSKKFLVIGLPMALALLYFGFWSSNMYISEARFSLRSAEESSSVELMALFGQSSSSSGADAYVIQQYIESPALLDELEEELQLKAHYQNLEHDFYSRLSFNPTREQFSRYFAKQISIQYDLVSGILKLKVKAFSPEMAQSICQSILTRSEILVNGLRERAIDDTLALTRAEVTRAEERLLLAQITLRTFRQNHSLIDPLAEAGAAQGVVAELESSAVKLRAELAEVRSYMQEDSAKIVSLKAKLQSLEDQSRIERIKLTGTDQETASSLASDYEQLEVEQEFARNQYTSAMTSLEAARIRAEGQSRYLVAFINPTLPQESLSPRRLYSIGVSCAVILLIYSLGSLIVAAVREHAGV